MLVQQVTGVPQELRFTGERTRKVTVYERFFDVVYSVPVKPVFKEPVRRFPIPGRLKRK
jgi:predicted glycosyltransferase